MRKPHEATIAEIMAKLNAARHIEGVDCPQRKAWRKWVLDLTPEERAWRDEIMDGCKDD